MIGLFVVCLIMIGIILLIKSFVEFIYSKKNKIIYKKLTNEEQPEGFIKKTDGKWYMQHWKKEEDWADGENNVYSLNIEPICEYKDYHLLDIYCYQKELLANLNLPSKYEDEIIDIIKEAERLRRMEKKQEEKQIIAEKIENNLFKKRLKRICKKVKEERK